MECCNTIVKTPYCPMCGNRVVSDEYNLLGLLKHIEATIKSVKTEIERLSKLDDGGDPQLGERINTWVAQKIKTLEKWQQWKQGLIRLMESSCDNV